MSGRAAAARAGAILLLVFLAVVPRALSIAGKPALDHDDSMTYVASSGRPFAEWTALEGRWVEAAKWKSFLLPAPGARLAGISRHLTDSGVVHPPLFFWLLHAWSLAFGTGLAAGPALNVLLACLTAAVLLRLGALVAGEGAPALAAAALFALSPGAVGVSSLVRPYELLMLLGALLALGAARFRAEGRGAGLLFGATLAGMLTHYEFAFLVAAAAAAVALPAAGAPRRRRAFAALASGVAASLLLNPFFYLPFLAQARATRAVSGGVGERLLSPESPSLRLLDHSFFTPPFTQPWSVLLGVLAGVALAALAAGAVRAGRRAGARRAVESAALVPALFFAAAFLGHFAAWVLGLLPLHATGFRYQAMTFPFLALLVAAAATGLGKAGRGAVALLAGVEAVGAALFVASLPGGAGWTVPPELSTAERVLVDHTGTGVLPRVVAQLPDATPVFADMQEALVARPERWRSELALARSAAWVSVDLFYDANGPATTRQVRRLIEERADVGATVNSPLLGGDVTAIRRREAPAAR